MLLALDVGNTNTVLGLYRLATSDGPAQPEMVANWRITTPPSVRRSMSLAFCCGIF